MSSNLAVAILPTALILLSLAIMASRTLAPIRAKPGGKVEYEMRLGLLQRVLSQKANVIAICALVALGGGVIGNTPWLGGGLGFIALAVMVGLLFVPQRVVFTSAGVMPSRAVFRPWKDFDAFDVSGRRITLHGSARLSSIRLFAAAANVADVERIVRKHVRRTAAQRTQLRAPRRRSA